MSNSLFSSLISAQYKESIWYLFHSLSIIIKRISQLILLSQILIKIKLKFHTTHRMTASSM